MGDDLQKLFREIICSDGGKLSVILREAIRKVNPCPFTSGVRNTRGTNTAYASAEKNSFIAHCINNWGLSTGDTPLIESCWDFVDYQLNAPNICGGSYPKFYREGFQIGSPWHGDILQAPVLFLSSNPGVTYRCFFPRWHSYEGFFTMGGLDESGNEVYDINVAGKNEHNHVAGVERIYEFLRDRFQTTYVNPSSGYPDAWVIGDGNKGGVQYWQALRRIMNSLLGFVDAEKPVHRIEHTRRLMRSVLSTEIIPFGSQGEYGASDDAMNFYRDKFIVPLLKKCGAKIIFLVGNKVRECFNRASKTITPSVASFVNGKIYPDTVFRLEGDSRVFQVAVIDGPGKHPEEKGQKISEYLNHDRVCEKLKAQRNNVFIRMALRQAMRLYSL